MPELGRKYTCYSCHTKFYDLGKPTPICPKCGSDQRDAEEAPVTTSSRSRRAPVIEEPADEPEFEAEPEAGGPVAAADSEDEEEIIAPAEREEEPEEEEEEEEY